MKRLFYLIIPGVLLAGLIVWRVVENRQQKTTQLQAASLRKRAAPNVRVAPAVIRDIIHEFQGVSNVESPFDVQISAKVTGRLTYLQAREGDRVTKGEVLARTDPSQVQASINQAQASVDSARANLNNAQVRYNRTYYLYKQGFTAAQDVDDARTQVEVQRSAVKAAAAQVQNLQSQLSDTILRSPINGFVTSRFLDPGSTVTAGQSIVTVQSLRRVYVTTAIPEGIQGVHAGIPASADFDAMPGRTFHGKVTQVNPAADPQSRQFLVRATFDNSENLIRPGMFGRLALVTHVTHNAVVVPHEAVQPGKDGPSVFVIDDKMVARKRTVKIGDQDSVGVAITQGIQPGEKVVILSAQPIRDGQQVKIDTSGPPVQLAGRPAIEGGGGGASPGAMRSPSTGGANAPTYSNSPTAPSAAGTSSSGASANGTSSSSSPGGAQSALTPSGGGVGTQGSGGPGATGSSGSGAMPATGSTGATGTGAESSAARAGGH